MKPSIWGFCLATGIAGGARRRKVPEELTQQYSSLQKIPNESLAGISLTTPGIRIAPDGRAYEALRRDLPIAVVATIDQSWPREGA